MLYFFTRSLTFSNFVYLVKYVFGTFLLNDQIDDSCPMCYWGLQMAMKWDAGYSVASQEAQLRMEELAAELRDILSKTERRLIKIALSFDETAACMVSNALLLFSTFFEIFFIHTSNVLIFIFMDIFL